MIYKVIVDISNQEIDRFFDYSSKFDVEIGSRVLVPFGRQTLEGFVIDTKEKSDIQTKDIIKVLDDTPVIIPEMIELAKWLKTQNLRFIDCLRLFIPSKLRGGKVKILEKKVVSFAPNVDIEEIKTSIKKSAEAQLKILDIVEKRGMVYESELNNISASAVKTLLKKGVFVESIKEVGRIPQGINIERKTITLTPEQQNAVETIINGKPGETFLVHGVTGCGKTEIYMNVIEKVLAEGKSAIMLVPEISLTPQMLGVFRARFGDNVSVLHSGLSDGERYDEWRRLRDGRAKVALGARSAIFAPVSNIGAIIIDEEHDSSYVSESNPRYFTIDIASFRAKYNGAKLVMGSATPSIDSYKKAKDKEYSLIALRNRANNKAMPEIETIDMRTELRLGNASIFSKQLLSALDSTLANGNQAMVFLNRRGYSSFLRCRSCGWVARCTDCDVSLTYHKEDGVLKCHYCGKQFRTVDTCPICGFKHLKEGKIGTEKVCEEINRIFPKARVLRMDNDTTTTKDSYIKILSAFNDHQADILVGTQMIAKGHDFKDVTLVGILDADLALYYEDYRSNERTFQLITQVAGRAGREKKAGRVIMQTYNPNHYVFKFAEKYDYDGFYEKESNARETTKFPPYTRIVRLLLLGKTDEAVMFKARQMYMELSDLKKNKYPDNLIRIQAMRAPLKRINNNYRFQVVVWLKPEAIEQIMPEIYQTATRMTDKDVTVFTEINPQQMM